LAVEEWEEDEVDLEEEPELGEEEPEEWDPPEQYYVDVAADSTLVVRRESDDKIVNDLREARFMLCPRCLRKLHYGTWDGKTFKCHYYANEVF